MNRYECVSTGVFCKTRCVIITEGINPPLFCPYSQSGQTCNWVAKKEKPIPDKKPEVPDWCKVGAWVYDQQYDQFGKITEVHKDTGKIEYRFIHPARGSVCDCFGGAIEYKNAIRARLRPWTFEEAPESVKTAENSEYRECCWHLNGIVKGEPSFFCFGDKFIPASKMAEEMVQLDGSPCGILEVAKVSNADNDYVPF